MKVKVTDCGESKEHDLFEFLSNEVGKVWGYSRGGQLEDVQEQTNSIEKTLVHLIILLMEKDDTLFDKIIEKLSPYGDKIELIKE